MGVYGTRSIIVPIASLASYREETARWVSFHYLHDLLQVRQLENDILRSKGFHLVHILFNVGIHFDNFHTCPYLLPEQLLASSDDRNKNRSRVCGGGGYDSFWQQATLAIQKMASTCAIWSLACSEYHRYGLVSVTWLLWYVNMAFRKLVKCGHCEQEVSKRTLYHHKRLYYDSKPKTWNHDVRIYHKNFFLLIISDFHPLVLIMIIILPQLRLLPSLKMIIPS